MYKYKICDILISMKPKKTTKPTVNTVIDHTVRAVFITLSVSILSLSVLSGVVSIFNTQPQDYAQAQGTPTDPADPDIAGPELPTGQTTALSARITAITRSTTELSVAFTTTNFTNQLNSNHTNFYFNTEANTSTNKSFYGLSPYTVEVSAIPTGATQLCVIVANASNTIVANSGNCMTIPAATTQNPGTSGNPAVETPETPTTTGETIDITGDQSETVTTTQPTTTPISQTNTTNTQALTAAQQAGTTARSGGLAVITGMLLLGLVGYYTYYKVKGDRKSILKMAEKKINIK